jgi:hypothetical protein
MTMTGTDPTDILLFGTGAFAARIAFDLAATAKAPVRVMIAGRNGRRLDWLRTAANARAAVFETGARFCSREVDLLQPGTPETVIGSVRPTVVVQAASVQTSAVIAASGDAWGQLVAEGGLSATAVFQAVLSARVARAIRDVHPAAKMINCCFPDVVNGILAAMKLPVLCGVGNVAILSSAFGGVLAMEGATRPPLQVLAHYQLLGSWRQLQATRHGPAPRVWISGTEVADVYSRFDSVLLTPEPAIEISGATGVPLMLAIAAAQAWSGHVPGPDGLPGGYPVQWRNGHLSLDLPSGLARADAIAWNGAFEAKNGLTVDGTWVRYSGRLASLLHDVSPSIAAGFDVSDLDEVVATLEAIRTRLLNQPATR